MALVTSQQLNKYYDLFKAIDVTFTKEVIQATGLKSQHIYLKCLGDQWPCVIYSSSLIGAKIIANTKSKLFEKIRAANSLVQLRFSFAQEDKTDPLTFFVSGKVTGYTPYSKENQDLSFINISYTQRPPDDLILVLGKLLEANINSKKRKEERIDINEDSLTKLGLFSRNAMLYIQKVPRVCILRDLSFSGAKLIIQGVAKFLVDKEAELHIELEDKLSVTIKGKIIRFESVVGRKDIAAVAMLFDEANLPMQYKMKINEYLSSVRKTSAGQAEGSSEKA
jgi:hypothetical protein